MLLLAALGSIGSLAAGHPAKSNRGFYYSHDEVRDVPWSIHIFKIERSHPDLQLDSIMGYGRVLGMSIVSQQVRQVPAEWGRVIAAINGDFFNSSRIYIGDPDGLQIVHGELVSSPNPERATIWMDAKGNPHHAQVTSKFQVIWPDKSTTPMGLNELRDIDGAVLYTSAVGSSTRTPYGMDIILERNGSEPWLPLRIGQTLSARVKKVVNTGNAPLNNNILVLSLGPRVTGRPAKIEPGAIIKISTATSPDLTGATMGMGGGPTLLEGGKVRKWGPPHTRHPRTAIGWNKEFIFLFEVDGRQRTLSMGMSFPELAQYMAKIGCQEAVNLDGGGSATMWVLGNVMNSPSGGYERPAANSLIVLQKPKK